MGNRKLRIINALRAIVLDLIASLTTTNAFIVRFPIAGGLGIRKVRKQWYILYIA